MLLGGDGARGVGGRFEGPGVLPDDDSGERRDAICQDFLEDERRSLGAAVCARECECVFQGAGGGMFPRSIVEAALTDKVKPLFGT